MSTVELLLGVFGAIALCLVCTVIVVMAVFGFIYAIIRGIQWLRPARDIPPPAG